MTVTRRAPKHHPSPDALLAYAAGQADPALRLLVEAHLEACDACGAETGAFSEPGGALLRSLGSEPVPGELFARVLAALPAQDIQDLSVPAPVSRLLPPSGKREWRGVLKRGIRFLQLMEDQTRGTLVYLLHLQNGAAFPHHAHDGMEDAVLLAGGATDGELDLDAGDWRHMEPGTDHAPRAKAGEDCWFLVRLEGGVAFSGWRGFLPT
jgi:putative transcriptional regulator